MKSLESSHHTCISIEEFKDEEETFGQELNFEITIDNSKKSGLNGIPENVE
jgi:CTP-dependent riboflavin kinase